VFLLSTASSLTSQPSEQKMSSPINFTEWDRQLNQKGADYGKLSAQMHQAAEKDDGANNVEILWRLAKVCFLHSLTTTSEGVITTRTLESYQYADKAVRISPQHFQANLWLANATGKIALIEEDGELYYK